jgi:hypothetical protein
MTRDEIIGIIKKYNYFAYNYISIKKANKKIKKKLEINSNPVWSKFPSNKLVKLLKQKEM